MNTLAQIAIDNPMWAQYGALGIITAFFMWRDVRRDKERDSFISELQALRHSFDGLQRSLLLSFAESDQVAPQIKSYAKTQIAKLERRMDRSPSND